MRPSISRREFLEVSSLAALGLARELESSPISGTKDASKTASDLINLPTGGGALTSIGEKFGVDPFSGTGNYAVNLEIPPGRNGFQPQLKLQYSSGNGNSHFGLGWTISVPGVSRRTSHGIPRYDDGRDIFILSGTEDLSPQGPPSGRRRYRPRTEGAFARIEHVTDAGRAEDYWEIRSKDGSVTLYGSIRPAPLTGAWVDPAVVVDPTDPRRRFAWRLSESRDANGNRVRYNYRRIVPQAVDGRVWDELMLDSIEYVNYGDPSNPSYLVQIKFHYQGRPDPLSDYRPGFETRTTQRCKRIEIWTRAGQASLARSYQLNYADENTALPGEVPLNKASLLTSIVTEGHGDAGASQRMPPLVFAYGAFDPSRRALLPVDGPELPQESLSVANYELVDLFGRGLSDIVELREDRVRYWKNLGGARFDRPRLMRDVPAGIALGDPGVRIMDADGDGRADLVVTQPGRAGYYPLSFAGGWDQSSYHKWRVAPSFGFDDQDVALVDLDGDGVTDAIRSGTSFECYFNNPANGWEETLRKPRRALDRFPNVSFSDPRVKWADMNGDGLSDVLLVEQDRIDYWPSVGRGDFAPRITMRNSPRLPFGYDPNRVLIMDVDGDGAADMVYVSDRSVTIWINCCGNEWSAPIAIDGTPSVALGDDIRVVDLLGSGVAGVLWNRHRATLPRAQMHFLDIVGGHKPLLLERIDNGMGAVTKIDYAPSTRFYLKDAAASLKWSAPLPFPVHVVARVEAADAISHGSLVTEYAYHHGYWDGVEREFRGFGRVDQSDTDSIAIGASTAGGAQPVGTSRLETRSWFYLGPVGEEYGLWTEVSFADEFWGEDAQYFPRPAALSALIGNLARRGQRDALRSLRGRLVRSELFSRDGSLLESRPVTVIEHLFSAQLIAPPNAAGIDGIFFPIQVAQRTSQWDRGTEPMTQFEFEGGYDAYGFAALSLKIAVPRGRNYRLSAAEAVPPFLASFTQTGYAQRDDNTAFIVDRVAHRTSYEVINDGLTTSESRPTAVELWEKLETWKLLSGSALNADVIDQVLLHYDGSDFDGLDIGALGTAGLLKREEHLVMLDSQLTSAFLIDSATTSATPPVLDHSGTVTWTGYPQKFRITSTRIAHAPPRGAAAGAGYVHHASDAIRIGGLYAAKVLRGYRANGLTSAQMDPLGNQTTVEYSDGYEYLPTRVVDAAGLSMSVEYNYRALQPSRMTDANGNVTAYRFGPLGMLEAVAILGKPGAGEGDTELEPSILYEYGLDSFSQTGQPVYVHSLKRSEHAQSGRGSASSFSEARELFDGFGRKMQTRALAEDVLFGDAVFGNGVVPEDQALNGPASARTRGRSTLVNVVVSGWQQYDNKGNVIARWEPFFSTGWTYEVPTPAQSGAANAFRYDPRGRRTHVTSPNGALQLTVFGVPRRLDGPGDFTPTPWETYVYDPNDNAGRTLLSDPKAAEYSSHWNTPSHSVFDARGQTVEEVRRNGPNADFDWYTARTEYDPHGNVIRTWDELGRLAFVHGFDCTNRRYRSESIDFGVRVRILNAAGDVIETRDAKGAHVLHAFDVRRQPIETWARDRETEPFTLRETNVFGHDPGSGVSAAAARDRNLLGRQYRVYDEAGVITMERYDFKGNVLSRARRVVSDAAILSVFTNASAWDVGAFRVDWEPPIGQTFDQRTTELLDTADYRIDAEYNAHNRTSSIVFPATTGRRRQRATFTYNRAGMLEQLSVDGDTYIAHIAYNAREQRTLVAYGRSGTTLVRRHAYNPLTFRVARTRVEPCTGSPASAFVPAGAVLQDLAYEYDLAGNVRRIHDRTPGCGLPTDPNRFDRAFAYDPTFRLLSATGRECDTGPPPPWDATPRCADQTRSRRFEQSYAYDPANNLRSITHSVVAATGTVPTRVLDLLPGKNQLATMTVGQATHRYTYDRGGNIVKENSERSLEWDHANRLRVFRIQPAGAEPSIHAQYLYDGLGRRVKKVVRKQGGIAESVVYVDGIFEAHRGGAGATAYAFDMLQISDGEGRVASIRDGTDPSDVTPAKRLYVTDHLDCVTAIVDRNGSWISREEYAPFGETTFGSFARKRFRLAGKECDSESGMYYFGARYLMPWIGRWACIDPAGEADGLNQYYYSRNNPIRFRDPGGTQSAERPEEVIAQASLAPGTEMHPVALESAPSADPPGELKLTSENLDPAPVSQTKEIAFSGVTKSNASFSGTYTIADAKWQGDQQTLRGNAPDSAFRAWTYPGITRDCGEYTTRAVNAAGYLTGGTLTDNQLLPRGHGSEDANGRAVLPVAENKQILDTIDRELYKGSIIAVAIDYHSNGTGGDKLNDHWFYITGREFDSTGSVYYTALDNATGVDNPNVKLYVNAETFGLEKAGLDPAPDVWRSDWDYRVVNVTPLTRVR